MRKEEAIYWKRFILKTIEDRLPLINPTTEDAIAISEFAKQHMQTITGQQMLPQSVFRKFLELFEKIPAIQEEIIKAQDEINTWLHNLPEECSVADIYAMFNTFGSPFQLDANGYIVVANMVYQDDDGYLVLPSPAMDIERYIEVVTI